MADSTHSSGMRMTTLAGNLLTAIAAILLALGVWAPAFAPYRPTLTIIAIVLITIALAMSILAWLQKR